MVAGLWSGFKLFGRIDDETFRKTVLALLLLAGLSLIVSTLPVSIDHRLEEITQRAIDLPGRPRWCVTDAGAERIFVCIREPSMILTARLPDLADVIHWPLPSVGAHGLDIDHSRRRLYAACDDGNLIEVDSTSGLVTNVWPIAGPPV